MTEIDLRNNSPPSGEIHGDQIEPRLLGRLALTFGFTHPEQTSLDVSRIAMFYADELLENIESFERHPRGRSDSGDVRRVSYYCPSPNRIIVGAVMNLTARQIPAMSRAVRTEYDEMAHAYSRMPMAPDLLLKWLGVRIRFDDRTED